MTNPVPRLVAVVAIAMATMLASACSPTGSEPEPTVSATPDAEPTDTAPEPQPEPSADADPETPTCENIISATTVSDFESLGWTALADTFRVGSVEIPEGIQCIWGDFSTATDHVQIFGWAPITVAEAQTAADELVAEGWSREEDAGGVYVTESPNTAIAVDDEGYGLTYLFGDGWVKYADTKQGLILIEWPPQG